MSRFYVNTLKIKRLKGPATGTKRLIATATADGSIQPLGKDRTGLQEGQFGATFVAYMDLRPSVFAGDVITDEQGVTYNVAEVVVRAIGAFPFQEIILKKS